MSCTKVKVCPNCGAELDELNVNKEERIYVCNSCDEVSKESEASDKYRCDECGSLFNEEDEAETCYSLCNTNTEEEDD